MAQFRDACGASHFDQRQTTAANTAIIATEPVKSPTCASSVDGRSSHMTRPSIRRQQKQPLKTRNFFRSRRRRNVARESGEIGSCEEGEEPKWTRRKRKSNNGRIHGSSAPLALAIVRVTPTLLAHGTHSPSSSTPQSFSLPFSFLPLPPSLSSLYSVVRTVDIDWECWIPSWRILQRSN